MLRSRVFNTCFISIGPPSSYYLYLGLSHPNLCCPGSCASAKAMSIPSASSKACVYRQLPYFLHDVFPCKGVLFELTDIKERGGLWTESVN